MAQKKRKVTYYNSAARQNPFLQQQWWIGLKGGVNVTKIGIDKRYSILAPTNYPQQKTDKKYENFKPIATHIGLEATYFFRGFSISVQPTYQTLKFTYSNEYAWADNENPNNMLELSYDQEHQVNYIVLPLIFKYEFNAPNVTPYIQAGAYFNHLINANKEVNISGIDYASGGVNKFESEPVMVGATDLFAKQHYGFMAGAGLYYNVGNIRLNFDVQYRLGQSVINSGKNRYNNDRLAGIGDAMDDITADNIAVSIGTLFPLRFLSSGFKSYDK